MHPLIQHYGNPLHLYCRLRDLGVNKRKSALLCKLYEEWIWERIKKYDKPNRKH